jgi:PAS domain S-box-containing protein
MAAAGPNLEHVADTLSATSFRRLLRASGKVSYPHINAVGGALFGTHANPIMSAANNAVELTHPDDRAAYVEAYARSATELSPLNHTRRVKSPLGEYMWARVISWPNRQPNGNIIFDGIAIDVTKERDANLRIRARERFTNAILDNIADSVVTIDQRGLILSINAAAAEMFGYYTDELRGHKVDILMPEPDRGAHDGYLRSYLTTGEGKILGIGPRGVIALRKDGTTFPIELTVGATEFGGEQVYIGTMRDITTRTEIDSVLRASEDRLLRILNSLPAMVSYVDADLRYQYTNDTYLEWHGLQSENLVGKLIVDVVGIDAYNTAKPRFDEALAGKNITFEASIPYSTAGRRNVMVSYSPDLEADGRIAGYYSLVIDLTERKLAEDQLRQSQKLEAVGQLTGGIAHDFNNLLAVIMGNTDLAKDLVQDGDPIEDYLDETMKATRCGADLTQRLLAFSRKQTLRPQVYCIPIMRQLSAEVFMRLDRMVSSDFP